MGRANREILKVPPLENTPARPLLSLVTTDSYELSKSLLSIEKLNSIQTNGLGMLRHNTVMLGWPGRWRQDEGFRKWKHLIEVLRVAHTKRCAIMIPKGVQEFPSNLTRLSGTIDVWWIVHDGGLLMLLPFLLKQTKVWKNCHMRIFTAARELMRTNHSSQK